NYNVRPCCTMSSQASVVYCTHRTANYTFFPYTTLFRSDCSSAGSSSALASEVGYRLGIPRVVSTDSVRQALRSLIGPELSPILQDRKSTRLNSSHVKISYAVFCLKKISQRILSRFQILR